MTNEKVIYFTEIILNNYFAQVFDDAYKSHFSCIVVDSIERLLGW